MYGNRVPETEATAGEDDLRGGGNGGVRVDDDSACVNLSKPRVGVRTLKDERTRAGLDQVARGAAHTVNYRTVYDEKAGGVVLSDGSSRRSAALAQRNSTGEKQVGGTREGGVAKECDVVRERERLRGLRQTQTRVGLDGAAVKDKRASSKRADCAKLEDGAGIDRGGASVGVRRVEQNRAAVVGERHALGGDGVANRADLNGIGAREHGAVHRQVAATSPETIGATRSRKGSRRVIAPSRRTEIGRPTGEAGHVQCLGKTDYIKCERRCERSAVGVERGRREGVGAGIVRQRENA